MKEYNQERDDIEQAQTSHSSGKRGKRPRKLRRDAGTKKVNERDQRVLSWVGEQKAARLDQVREQLSRTPGHKTQKHAPRSSMITLSAVLQVVDRWTALGLVTYKRVYDNEPGWIWLTPLGLSTLRLPYARLNPMPSTFPHLYQINRVRLSLERRHPEYRWVSERTLAATLPKRTAGQSVPHLPDAQVWLPKEPPANGFKPVAVEVERSPKSDRELDDILTQLLISGTPTSDSSDRLIYTTVWYFLTLRTRSAVEAARNRLPPEFRARVQLIPLESL